MALSLYGQPIYVRREIVHNKYVVNDLRRKGIIFVNEIHEVPAGSRIIFSAHGVPPDIRDAAAARALRVIDATCPLVTKVHREAVNYARRGYSIILIGHSDHDEVIGTLGEAPEAIQVLDPESEGEIHSLSVSDSSRIVYLTQTTLSLNDTRGIVEKLRRKFPLIKAPASEDICYATQNRQAAVLRLAREAEMILVVGSANSSNSRRLVEVAEGAGTQAHLIDDIEDIQPSWLRGVRRVGLTAGASAPESLVAKVVRYLNALGFPEVTELGGIAEKVEFAIPSELTSPALQKRSRD